jgi:hypothetical protein
MFNRNPRGRFSLMRKRHAVLAIHQSHAHPAKISRTPRNSARVSVNRHSRTVRPKNREKQAQFRRGRQAMFDITAVTEHRLGVCANRSTPERQNARRCSTFPVLIANPVTELTTLTPRP